MNLLTNPLFRAETVNGPQRFSLPALLSALGKTQVESLTGLQRHQADAFHIFLCQLAASVLVRENNTDPKQDEAFWRDGIRRLTGRDDDCAWTLVVEDVGKPAFMQPPIPGDSTGKLKPAALTPDDLDILPTAKNHDVKTARSVLADPDEWVYALINLQTTAGFFGRGNYGIARMNGGFSSRPCVELQANHRVGSRWSRDTTRLLAYYSTLLAEPWPYKAEGHMLLWIFPWDGNSRLALSSLHPFFIEIARIVRLSQHSNGSMFVNSLPSDCTRIIAKEQKGNLGDPWIPVKTGKKETTALTVSANGFTPELLHDILFSDGIEPAFMQRPAPDEIGQPMTLYASVLVRGQGTTDGFHTARVPIPTKAGFVLFSGRDEKQHLQEISKQQLADARTMQNKVLKFALFSLLEGGPEKVDFDKTEISAWVTQIAQDFAQAWSHDYFDWLWRSLDHENEDAARLEWLQSLETKARRVLDEAMQRLPERAGRRLRARVEARDRYFGALSKHFPELKEDHDARCTA